MKRVGGKRVWSQHGTAYLGGGGKLQPGSGGGNGAGGSCFGAGQVGGRTVGALSGCTRLRLTLVTILEGVAVAIG